MLNAFTFLPADPYKYLVIIMIEYHGASHLHKYN